MEAAGHECVGFCEIDKFARMSYKAIHGLTEENEYTEWEWHNVRSLSNKSIRKLQRRVGKIDVICGGFPCQSFSIAGKRRGFDETRGTLFFEIARTASILKPKYLFLENVKGLLNHAGGDTFETVLRTLDELGYNCEWQLLNSKDFGVPQNREHVFIIGHLRGSSGRAIFPIASYSSKIDEGRIIASTITARYSTSQREGSYIATDGQIKKYRQLEGKRFNQMNRVAIIQKPRGYNKGGEHEISPTLSANSWHENNLLKIGGVYTNDSESYNSGILPGLSRTLKAQNHDAGLFDGTRLRKLTPRECWRLQGFPDWAFDKAQEMNSDSQLYKQAGNSVTVNVIFEIARRLR